MSNERPNEFLPWRAQLTKPDALPELGLDDKELSWQHLAERLGKQPRRPGMMWWLAAAFLLAFFLPAIHHSRPRPAKPNRVALHPPVNRKPITPSDAHVPIQTIRFVFKTTGSVRPSIQPISRSSFHQISRPSFDPISRPSFDPISHPSIQPMSLLRAADTTVTINPPIVPTTFAALSVTIRPADPLPRRHLRIAYLNEINNPGPSPVWTSRRPPFLRLGTASATEYNVNNNTPAATINITLPNH